MATRHRGVLYLNVSDIARRWRMTPEGVLRGAIQPKKLKAYRSGREVLVKETDLQEYETKVVRPKLIEKRAEIDQRLGWLDEPLPEPPDLNFTAYGK